MTREFITSGGTLTIRLLQAKEQTTSSEKWIEPRLKIEGTLKVRGVEYRVRCGRHWLKHDRSLYQRGHDTGKRTHWQADNYYGNEFWRVSTDKKAEFGTPTWYALEAMVSEALAEVETSWPDWQRESCRLRLTSLIASREDDLKLYREQIKEAEESIRDLRAEFAALNEI